MSPFCTSFDRSGFRDQLAAIKPGIETTSPKPSEVTETSRPIPHWWQRFGRKRCADALVPNATSSSLHKV